MHEQPSRFLTKIVIFALLQVGCARDLRNVTEPKTPQICMSLKATGRDDTDLIQTALNSCTTGKAVSLSSGVFHSGPLTIPSGVSLLVDKAVTLKATPDPKLYDQGAKTCGTLDDYGVGCKAFITMLRAKGSGIYGKGAIDGQGGEKMTGTNTTWWQLSHDAKVNGKYQNNPRLIQINNSVDITVYQITLKNSPFYHLTSSETNGFTVWGITIDSANATRNTDGVNPMGSQNVTIAYCNIRTVDDNIAIKAVTAPSRHISVYSNHFNHGDGVAIGSEVNNGVSDVTFIGLTLNHLIYGIYIKSDTLNGGLVTNITYENICIENVRDPICLDTNYYNKTGDRIPEIRNITFNNIWVHSKGNFIFNGLNDSFPVYIQMNDVHIKEGSRWSVNHAKITGSWKNDVSIKNCGYYGNNY
ncbi:endo-polygalacturonase-like [Bacillus rossius redtenbacheri]|uniref:endo-polygalacturonase-like n=1 Tax=Bacillus rossius redtenbacheri TaxID=93214 RepID=UPI002FDDDC8D